MTEYREYPEREIPQDTGDAETTRATGMGNPGQFPGEAEGPVDKVRHTASGKLQDTARRVRELGDRAAARNQILGRTQPIAYNAADGIDHAARYVRDTELDQMRNDIETQVRRHPLTSVALAFIAGYTLRRLF